jgi:hypothetical protein
VKIFSLSVAAALAAALARTLVLKDPLVAGSHLPLVLTFRQAGAIAVQANVQAATSTEYEDHPGHAARAGH